MKRNSRRIIFTACVVSFLLFIPYIVLYSLGYRVNIASLSIVATGGIYVHALPENANVTIDGAIQDTTGLFSNAFFVQNLVPGPHTVSIAKDGYFDYQKTLPVAENQVTKLEHVVLFKKTPAFSILQDDINLVAGSPDGTLIISAATTTKNVILSIYNTTTADPKLLTLAIANATTGKAIWSADSKNVVLVISGNYYLVNATAATPKATLLPYLENTSHISFDSQNSSVIFYVKNKNLYSDAVDLNQAMPLFSNALAYVKNGSNIMWLSGDGFLNSFDTIVKSSQKVTAAPLGMKNNSSYKLLKVSANGDKTLLYGNHELLYFLNTATAGELKIIPLQTTASNIAQADWVNDDYIIFTAGDTIMISEAHPIGNVNIIALPSTISPADGSAIAVTSPDIYFSSATKKLYLLAGKILLVSERLLP